jgi:dipeptidase D
MLENLEPKNVFQYFEEICHIPHGSGNVDAISNYLVAFAKEHHLQAIQDEWKNVIIIKEASKGKEDRPALMIQGHMDMVAVKDPDVERDLTKEPLKLAVDGDYLYAEGTSLGGDDGIAVAYGLALLADETISHPRIELVVTTEEEVGMEGATGIDLSVCQAEQMLNLDSEEEGEFVAACAGGVRVNGTLSVHRVNADGKWKWKKIMLTGFTGGHSGTEIDKNGGNANIVMSWFLQELIKEVDIKLNTLYGGEKDNAIPIEATAVIGIGADSSDNAYFEEMCRKLEKEMQTRFAATDSDCRLILEDCPIQEKEPMTYIEPADSKRILSLLTEMPNGVQSMSRELEGLVQTSLNLGIVKLTQEELQVVLSLRSSVAEEKEALKKRVSSLIEQYQGTVKTVGDYPAWEYKKQSSLREHLVRIYEKQYGKKPLVLSIHAGLECGILAAKKPGLDCVALGPDILEIHTTRERMSISSVARVWKFLVEVIETL